MSRIGKKPIDIVKGVTITVNDRLVTVQGPKGTLTYEHRPEGALPGQTLLYEVQLVVAKKRVK